MSKTRLDIYLAQNGLAPSRERAKAMIMEGIVFVDNQKCDKAGEMIKENSVVEVRGNTLKYVSRGGLKLEKALMEFPIDLHGRTAMDIGASTGGFTDCMLQNGAKKVYSVDVGYGQLAWSLRNDERVVNMERTNVRYLTENDIGETPDFASIDVSFISLRLVLPIVKELLSQNGEIIALIKPQFEAGREQVGKKGVVKELSIHIEVIKNIIDFAQGIGLFTEGLSYSPIKGPEGNIEYLLYMKKTGENKIDLNIINDIARKSHELEGK